MSNPIKVTRIDLHEFQWETRNLAPDEYYNGFNQVYKPGAVFQHTGHLLQHHTDQGISGEFPGVAYDWDFILAHRTGLRSYPG